MFHVGFQIFWLRSSIDDVPIFLSYKNRKYIRVRTIERPKKEIL
jgi:hypothetical protein